jgi:hypothetical protein
VAATLVELIAAREIASAEDVASVLHHRVDRWASAMRVPAGRRSHLIGGTVPEATHVSDPDLMRALRERAAAIERQAEAGATTMAALLLSSPATSNTPTWVQAQPNRTRGQVASHLTSRLATMATSLRFSAARHRRIQKECVYVHGEIPSSAAELRTLERVRRKMTQENTLAYRVVVSAMCS